MAIIFDISKNIINTRDHIILLKDRKHYGVENTELERFTNIYCTDGNKKKSIK